MRVTASRRRARGPGAILLSALVLSLASFPSAASAQARPVATTASAATAAELERARATLDKYRDPVVAIREGYLSTLACIEYPKGGTEAGLQFAPGGMGVHFINMQHVGPTLDPAKPQVLIYEPVGDELRLVAAEWFVPLQVAGQTRPTIFGRQLEGPMEGHEPVMPAGLHHYDLHVWLWKDNPAGTFSPTNPSIKCQKGRYTFAEHAPKLVRHGAH